MAPTQKNPGIVLSTDNVTRFHGLGKTRVLAVREVSVEIPRSSWTSVMGPSGSGKTSLLHLLAGLSTPDVGRVTLHRERHAERIRRRGKLGVELSSLSENARAKLRRTELGVVFQDFNLVPVLSVADNIRLPLRLARRRTDSAWFNEVVETLGLGNRLKHLPHELSGGQRQRAAIARALLPRPSVIFADEPTGNLDSESGMRVLDLFRRLVDNYGQTLVLVTHDPAAAEYGDQLIRMKDGQVQE